MKHRNKSAFTLIELLVVIAIIAILAAILFPVFAQAKLAAKKANDLSQNKQLDLAHLMYSNDYDDAAMSVPYAATWSTSCPGCGPTTAIAPGGSMPEAAMGPWWTDRLMPYVKNKGLFADPVDNDTLFLCKGYQVPGLDLADSLTWYANLASNTPQPAALTAQTYRVTYTFNEFLSHADNNPFTPGAAQLTSVPQPADTVMLGPSDNWFNRSQCHTNGTTNSVDYDWDVSIHSSNGTGGTGYEIFGGETAGTFNNGGFNMGANFAFVDGHAKYEKYVKGPEQGFGATSGFQYYAFWGYYPQAKTNPDFGGVGNTCPTTYLISKDANTFEF
jgi:prepilin-type N-terminal cleavage/methylation domain-containing protein/prepilin-type processing-associated H-X9-DG protein